MQLSNIQRIKKLVHNLCFNPDLVLPYIRHNLIHRRSPVQLRLPWWSYRAIQKMDEWAPGRRIFEYGCGGSTLRYARVAGEIRVVEDDDNWLRLVRDALYPDDLAKVHFIHAPFDFKQPKGLLQSEYLHALNQAHDIVIIDGQDHTFNERITCFNHAEGFVVSGGIIVVDDFWRYTSLLKTHSAKRVEVCESTGPCRFGVTNTAFFYY